MKYIFFTLWVLVSFFSVSWLYAASGDISDLSIKSIKTLDDRHIRVVFSEAIDTESVTIKINKQSDNAAVRINILTGVVDVPEAIDLTLEDTLSEGSSYTAVVIAAVGISGATITDGAQAVKDFVTTNPLKKSILTLNAPSNPKAVMAKTGVTDTKVTLNPKPEMPVSIEELPLTGMNPFILLLLILPFSYLLLRRRA